MFPFLAALFGLIFGSFASAAAHRIPRRESFATGRSKCPHCGRTITALENVPVFSYLALRGRCRGCGEKISIRYPIIEVVTGGLFAAAAWKFDLTVAAFVYMAFFWALVVLTAIDLEHQLLPDRVVFPTFVLGWLGLVADAVVEDRMGRLVDAGIGALIFGGFFFLIVVIVPKGMGGGDVKLAPSLGTFLGYVGAPGVVLAGMFLSFLLGGVIGLVAMKLSGGDRKMQIPFGPFLAAGTVLGIFVGQTIVDAYLGRL